MSAEVKLSILNCERCELSRRCDSPVPWSGPAPNPFCVIGEAPGEVEDRRGQPFVGPSGRLLRLAIDIAFGEKGYAECLSYLNVVSCYPHSTPRATHIRACQVNVEAQLRVLQPRYGLCCGGVALNALWPAAGHISSYRGLWLQLDRDWGRSFWLAVWHPAAVLREPRKLTSDRGQQLVADLGGYAQTVLRYTIPDTAKSPPSPYTQLTL